MEKVCILTAEQMRQCDSHTIRSLGVPSQVLMERAAHGVVHHLKTRTAPALAEARILVLCGSGNNGGDGFAVARFLREEGIFKVSVCYGGKLTEACLPDTKKMSEECARQYGYLRDLGVSIQTPDDISSILAETDLVIDALFGIGLDRPITGGLADLIDKVNQSGIPVVALDIPSGIHSDTGEIMGVAIKATETVAIQALKQGLVLYPGADYCGHIHVCDIGIHLSPADGCKTDLASEALLRELMPTRARRSHKGTYGQLALVCGSLGMSGAAVLATRGALRSGVGLVRVVTPDCNREILQGAVYEAIVTCYDALAPVTKDLISTVTACDGMVMGCGLGISLTSATLMGALLDACPIRKDFPVVLDADALNLLSKYPHLYETRLLTEGCGQVVITPHPAEMSRLSGRTVADVLADPLSCARDYAKSHGLTVVLKDAHTVIATPDGHAFICPYGNAGMAKGGSGDVLAGIIGSLAVQSRKDQHPAYAAVAGVLLHALAGDSAAKRLGEYAMTPSDLIDSLAEVTQGLSDTKTQISFF